MHAFRSVLAVLAAVVVVGAALLPGVNAMAVTGFRWGTATEVPGLAALNSGVAAQMTSMSCPSSGNCVAGGWYTDSSGNTQAFVVDEVGGVWGKAIEVPGTAALNVGGQAGVNSVSCSSPGNCAAGGDYQGNSQFQAFVVNETGGVWGQAIEVPGTAALNQGGIGGLDAVSCAPGAPGNCAALGGYRDSSGNFQTFAADAAGGVWGQAIELPGTAALNTGGLDSAQEVSCQAPGDCTVGGSYEDSAGNQQAFVASQTGGVWGTAIELPGTAALNHGPFSGVDALSCTSPGNCEAGGIYSANSSERSRSLFLARQKNGSWARATQMPGIAALNVGQFADVSSISCTSAGNCAAGGFYEDSAFVTQGFVINEAHGAWGQAAEVPGLAKLNKLNADVSALSCSAKGNCVAAGTYTNRLGHVHNQAFVADQTAGVWRQAIQVPGAFPLNTGKNASVSVVSCARGGTCSLGGFYTVTYLGSDTQVFVDSQG